MNTKEKISNLIQENAVVLFMKGTPDFPECGFSAKVAQILEKCNITYKGINVLDDSELRQGIKDYANWPTIPQLYINAKFIGGCDIVSELYAKGELQNLLPKT